MPLISLSLKQSIIAIIALVPLFQIMGAVIATKMPADILNTNNWLFKTRDWEDKGAFYKKVFRVHKWKKYLPDGAKYFKGDFEKKHMRSFDREYIEKFICESCRAELVHWLGMVPFVLFYLFLSTKVANILIVYSILFNLPCIITQRYNRPRLCYLLSRKEAFV